MIERFEGKTPEKELEKDFASIRAFEKQLTDDGNGDHQTVFKD